MGGSSGSLIIFHCSPTVVEWPVFGSLLYFKLTCKYRFLEKWLGQTNTISTQKGVGWYRLMIQITRPSYRFGPLPISLASQKVIGSLLYFKLTCKYRFLEKWLGQTNTISTQKGVGWYRLMIQITRPSYRFGPLPISLASQKVIGSCPNHLGTLWMEMNNLKTSKALDCEIDTGLLFSTENLLP